MTSAKPSRSLSIPENAQKSSCSLPVALTGLMLMLPPCALALYHWSPQVSCAPWCTIQRKHSVERTRRSAAGCGIQFLERLKTLTCCDPDVGQDFAKQSRN